ncbi:nucleoside-diphosphate-sugar epimerase [Chitinivorax tropicus]|uniref:Nucleoside-diphosphate-sugar epimerase n=1 Tax=Chitinivorax tropicus TaxID=714531 RepID=A0A840MV71_9PROT|nr:NAD(P)-dependent oxidoreductase [Chitinivorax tropicus]MBB5020223.1 nucleoside-diphosphate-sugar epimerase [Chitinivorax tropicus]
MMKVAVIGASGVIGRRLVAKLLKMGAHVRCIARATSTLPTWPNGLYERVTADILDEASLTAALQGQDVVINLATSIPNGKGKGDWQLNDRIRIEGTRNLLAALAHHGNQCRLVQQSIAMLHQSSELVDECAEVCGQGVLTSALVMEAAIQSSAAQWVLIRGGAVYGPDTARDEAFFRRIQQGLIAPPESPGRYLSLIHIDDLVGAFMAALHLPLHEPYIAADSSPLTYRTLFASLGQDGEHAPDATPLNALPSFRVSNQRLMKHGWRPRYSNVLQYLEQIGAMHTEQTTRLLEKVSP